MSRIYLSYDPEQRLLLPPDLRDWLPEGHLALFISDVVDELELQPLLAVYESGDGGGRPPYHPLMMVKLLVYGYCLGRVSSRKLEQATYEDIAFRVLACNQHPDHDSIAEFRKRHLPELAKLFVQVLRLCAQAGLVKLGHVAVDGSKLRANASKHKAMSYERMCEKEQQLAAEVERLLQAAATVDAAEDEQYGQGQRARVIDTDHVTNRITVRFFDGRELTYNPTRLSGVSVYYEAERAFAEGDRLQIRAPFREKRIANGALGTIAKIEPDRIRLAMDSGREISI